MYDFSNLEKLSGLEKNAPEAMEGFKIFDFAAMSDGAISKKNKELIAIAVALTTQCVYCLEVHKRAALEAGASKKEIAEATFVAAALRAGAAITHSTHLF